MDTRDAAAGLRVVLFATVRAAPNLPVPPDFPAALLPLGHAPVVVRLLEQLVQAGVKDVDIVACDRPELLRRELGDGERWGLRLRWHLAKDPARPYALLRSAPLPQASRMLIAHADRWVSPATLRRLVDDDHLLVHLDPADGLAWTGWASLPAALLEGLSADCDQRALGSELGRRGLRAKLPAQASDAAPLDAAGLLRAQAALIAGSADAPLPAAWIPMPWGAMSPQARVHSGATIEGPALIGPGCLVAAEARIGPNAVLSRDVVVGAGTRVSDAVVLPDTYLGQGLEVRDAVVNGGRIRHLSLGVETVLPASDGLMLSLERRPFAGPSPGGRLAAAAVAALLSPALAVATLWRRRDEPALPWRSQPVVAGLDLATRQVSIASLRIPRPSSSALRHALAHYGGLLDVLQGRRCWFGVRPRPSGEWYALSPEWQSLIASAPIGLLNAPAWAADDGFRQEAGAAADAFYAVRGSWRENVRVALAALRDAFAVRAQGRR